MLSMEFETIPLSGWFPKNEQIAYTAILYLSKGPHR